MSHRNNLQLRMNAIAVLFAVVGLAGCGQNLQTLLDEATSAASSTTSSSTSSSSSDLYSKSTEDLAEEATEEVSTEESCQTEEVDFDAVKESLTAKLTALIAKLEAVDTTEFSDEQLEKHEAFLEEVKADLEVVEASTELSDDLKAVIQKVWKSSKGGREKSRHKHGFGHRGNPGVCESEVKEKKQSKHCADIERLLEIDDISSSLRTALEERYAEQCVDEEEDSSTDSSSESSSDTEE